MSRPSGRPASPSGRSARTAGRLRSSRLPQTGGRPAALARARAARAKGLPQVGILDSSRYASLHPGYWIVFSGVYASEAEATSALERHARRRGRPATSGASCRDRALPSAATRHPDFVTRSKRRYTLRGEASASRVFRPVPRNSGRPSRFVGRPRSPTSLLYVSILASDLSLDQGSDRPVRVAGRAARLPASGARRVRAHDGAPRRGSALLRASRPRPLRRHPSLLPDHGAGAGRLDGAGRHRCGHVVHRAADRGRAARRRRRALPCDDAQGQGVPADASPGRDFCPSHQHLEHATVAA